jgi:hypothetical protein
MTAVDDDDLLGDLHQLVGGKKTAPPKAKAPRRKHQAAGGQAAIKRPAAPATTAPAKRARVTPTMISTTLTAPCVNAESDDEELLASVLELARGRSTAQPGAAQNDFRRLAPPTATDSDDDDLLAEVRPG